MYHFEITSTASRAAVVGRNSHHLRTSSKNRHSYKFEDGRTCSVARAHDNSQPTRVYVWRKRTTGRSRATTSTGSYNQISRVSRGCLCRLAGGPELAAKQSRRRRVLFIIPNQSYGAWK